MSLDFLLTYADVPFVLDTGKSSRLCYPFHKAAPTDLATTDDDLIDDLNRLLPDRYFKDMVPTGEFQGRNLSAMAIPRQIAGAGLDTVKIGEWYYPAGAARWSVFRGLATSSMAKAMVASALGGGAVPRQFIMQSVPVGAPAGSAPNYTLNTNLYLLPPRPLAETAGNLDGLYLITLVDERYYWQTKNVTLHVNSATTWLNLLGQLEVALGVTLALANPIGAVYQQPEPDSQWWVNRENAAVLLDAVCYNLGITCVRKMSGSYVLESNSSSQTIVTANRAGTTFVRIAGGSLFGGAALPVGSLTAAKNAVVPQSVDVTFPYYVEGDAPVPHFLNPRYTPPRPSCWYEQSYGSTYVKNVPFATANAAAGGAFGNLIGVGTHAIHTTAKALVGNETAAALAAPKNQAALDALAVQLAVDYIAYNALSALDEVYPGTYNWTPEGYDDIVWTYSAKRRQASCRVMRFEWNLQVREMQHSTPPYLSTNNNTPRGVGGPSVAQTWRETYDYVDIPPTTLAAAIGPNSMQVVVKDASYLPVQYRWRANIDQEIFLFAPTGGSKTIDVIYRGIDGSLPGAHAKGAVVDWNIPDTAYGVNLATLGNGFFGFPGLWTSGGISEEIIACPLRTVEVFGFEPRSRLLPGDANEDADVIPPSGQVMNGWPYYSGQIIDFDPSQNPPWTVGELVWVVSRNSGIVPAAQYYGGQFVAPGSPTPPFGTPAPVYAITPTPCCSGEDTSTTAGGLGSKSYVWPTSVICNTTGPSSGQLTVGTDTWTFGCAGNLLSTTYGGDATAQAPGPSQVTRRQLIGNEIALTTRTPHGLKVGQGIVVTGIDKVFNTPAGSTDTVDGIISTNAFTYSRTHADIPGQSSTGTVTPALC